MNGGCVSCVCHVYRVCIMCVYRSFVCVYRVFIMCVSCVACVHHLCVRCVFTMYVYRVWRVFIMCVCHVFIMCVFRVWRVFIMCVCHVFIMCVWFVCRVFIVCVPCVSCECLQILEWYSRGGECARQAHVIHTVVCICCTHTHTHGGSDVFALRVCVQEWWKVCVSIVTYGRLACVRIMCVCVSRGGGVQFVYVCGRECMCARVCESAVCVCVCVCVRTQHGHSVCSPTGNSHCLQL